VDITLFPLAAGTWFWPSLVLGQWSAEAWGMLTAVVQLRAGMHRRVQRAGFLLGVTPVA